MARLPVIAAAVLAIAASASVIGTASAGWRDRDGDVDRDLRDLLRDRIQTRQDLRDFIIDLFHDRQDLRRRLRERVGHWRDRGDEEDEDGGGLRGRLRERVGDRVAERRRGGEEGDCYILTRSLRDADRDLLVVVRRRVCRD
jgi:hypothetical protein